MNKLSISTIAMLGALSFSGTIYAHDFNNNTCNTNIDGEISFANNLLEVKSDNDEAIVFNKLGKVSIDGTNIDLSSIQQAAAKAYYENVEASIPLLVEISTEAIDMTRVALTEVFSEILDSNSNLPTVIGNKLEDVSKSIKNHVYADPNSLTFNTQYLEEELGFDNGFDQKLEEIKEEVMASFMGEIFMGIGKAMMNGNGNFDDFEGRMEALGKDIEEKAESLAEKLEQKTQGLCEKFQAIDQAETELQSVKELRGLDIIQVRMQKA